MLRSKYAQVLEDLYFYSEYDMLVLSDIYIKEGYKGRGYGTKIMQELVAFADKEKLPIKLVPAAGDIHGASMKRLKNFYRHFGFVENKDAYFDSRFDDEYTMYRLPK
jgi:GNAT superfamily N-acetyltransferase